MRSNKLQVLTTPKELNKVKANIFHQTCLPQASSISCSLSNSINSYHFIFNTFSVALICLFFNSAFHTELFIFNPYRDFFCVTSVIRILLALKFWILGFYFFLIYHSKFVTIQVIMFILVGFILMNFTSCYIKNFFLAPNS